MPAKRLFRGLLALALLGIAPAVTSAQDESSTPTLATREIDAYLARDEPDFQWQTTSEVEVADSRVIELELTSQRWQGGLWKHTMIVYEPQRVVHPDKMLLFVTGGSTGKAPGVGDRLIGASLANLCGGRVAMLHQVPNQPLMDGRHEDDLISQSWLKYLETGDSTWPLLFPMVKSATKAMDSLEQLSVKQGWQKPSGFVIAGASKRGWTSWLTAATDSRIIATAPIVIDFLDFPAQMKHQIEMWGTHSEQIEDYTRKDLVPRDGQPTSGRAAKLWKMMDPIEYLDRLQMPKLLVVGANDRYWTTDAMNLYWDRLGGEKWIHRVPNAGHSLGGGRMKAISTLAVFFQAVAAEKQLPEIDWQPATTDGEIRLTVSSEPAPIKATLWVASSESLDFRDSVWEPSAMTQQGDEWVGSTQPDRGHQAAFAELTFLAEDTPYSLATLVYYQ
ncbi:PhoPQ-activated pathogenicity-related family protein [Allorhodopirellula solitaria]|uniref:PhoPQ-activated pathogenicity-related protein n=1 Tax=Allorhodopirellula solitaria TaxID=2527987 RepID=A0A5C5WPG4_9BACT|nr:PhoPQ-activated protein PqaA family protein [Allorhodopirellula solitaria]TWT51903.1 PhoPQ-activated pathogenicity-related protein [Allorhodopirellula solitaria]